MGRLSSIDRLPKEVREELISWVMDPALTHKEVTDRTNELLAELDSAQRISKSALNRYSQRLHREMGRVNEGVIPLLRKHIILLSNLLDRLEGNRTGKVDE